MSKRNGKSATHQVAIEISRDDVALVVIERRADGSRRVRGRRLPWRVEAKDINETGGAEELATAINTLVAEEKLSGMSVHVALNSNYCVTRVAAGEREKVLEELRVLHGRSNQYLMLGPGEKAIARSLHPIDAKQSQGWLTVTNRDTLDIVVDTLMQANLQIDLIEHAMVSMCRAVAKMPTADEAPAVIVELSERGIDIGVTHNGRLLFDYRPGGLNSKTQVAQIIQRHLERIQRYCNRHFPFAEGRIGQVFICGAAEDFDEVRAQLEEVSELRPIRLTPHAFLTECAFDDATRDESHFVAPLGAALLQHADLEPSADVRGIANLVDFVRSVRREPVIPGLMKLAWPVAAALLLAALLHGGAFLEGQSASRIEREQKSLDGEMALVSEMRAATQVANTRIAHLRKIDAGTFNPGWHQLLSLIGRSMPEPVWLEGIRVEQDGAMTITGPSRTQDAIFEFVRYLQKIPVLQDVNLESQIPVNVDGPAIRFDIKCRYVDRNDLIERTARND